MSSLWDVVTGKVSRKDVSATARAEDKQAAQDAKDAQAARAAKEQADAEKKVKAIQFKKGGAVKAPRSNTNGFRW